MLETALALAVIDRGGPAANRMLEYLVWGDWPPSVDGPPIDMQFAPDEGWGW